MLKSLKPLLNPVKPTKQPTKQPSNLTPQTGKIPIVGVKSFGKADPVLVANTSDELPIEPPVPEPSPESNPTVPSSPGASDLGGPITNTNTNTNSGDVIIGGDNNGVVNTGIINLDPTRRTSRNSNSLSANIKISFSNRGLEYAGVRVNYTSNSNRNASSSLNNETSESNLALGFEIDYTRKDLPDAPKVEGADRSGENLIRSTEGGGTLKFAFKKPLDKGDSVVAVVVNKGEKTAAATVKRSDGSTYVELARVSNS